jgi:hypothetical protein
METKKTLGLLIIRGSGHSGFKRQEIFMNRLNHKLNKMGINPECIAFELVDWYGPLQEQQEIILQRMKEANINLKSYFFRQLIITNIGDLINYGGKPGYLHYGYKETHKLIHQTLMNLKKQLHEEAPLLIVAASMGTEIINNYILDRQAAAKEGEVDPLGNSPFERFETLTGLFTLGNNLPIFAASHLIDEIHPIDFPSARLPTPLKKIAVWENYYDKNDAMGYPIKPLNKHFERNTYLKDIQINTGGLLSYWNILSHFGYWRSRNLVRRLAVYIGKLLMMENRQNSNEPSTDA